MRGKPISWLPFDSRLLPFDFAFKTPHSRFVKTLLVVEMILAFVSVVGSLFLVVWPKQNPSSFLRESLCQEKRDCVLGIRIDECCNCPNAYLKEEIEKEPGLVVWEPKKDYRFLKPRSCREVYCPACSFYEKAYCCSGGVCRGMSLPRIVSQ